MTLQEEKNEFESVLRDIKNIFEKIGVNINIEDYNGMVLKFLGISNTIRLGKTNHIALTGDQRDIFPYLYPIRYFDNDDEEFKSYYVLKVPINLSKSNCWYLKNNEKMPEDEVDEKITSFSTVLRSKRDNQLEFSSQIKLDDKKLIKFRESLPKNSFLVILKLKNKVEYDLFGFPGKVDLLTLDEKRKHDLNELKTKIKLVLQEDLAFDEFKTELSDEIYQDYDFDKFKKEFKTKYKELKKLNDENELDGFDEKIFLAYNDETVFNEFKEESGEEFKEYLYNLVNLNELNDAYDLKQLGYGLSLYDFKNNFYKYYSANSPNTKTLVSINSYEVNQCTDGENVLLYGVPGSGKSWTIDEQYCNDESRMERVVFHPDYTYSDFIGQILPKIKENKNDDEKEENEDKIIYKFTPGPFTSILKKAKDDPTHGYFLIIEEINRGNAPAIFGDVFQLLDRITDDNKEHPKGTSKYAITNPEIADVVYENKEEKVRIPSNLSIIATMNTSDQNVFTLDTAFQRRWNMRLIENNFNNVDEEFKKETIIDTDVKWATFCTKINDLILKENSLYNSSEDKRLGVYFVNKDDLNHFIEEKDVAYCRFSEKVLKYLWDDAFKFNHEDIFKTEYKSLEEIIRKFNSNKSNKRFMIFNNDFIEELGINSTTFELKETKND